jgi:serine/threonine protein kinase
MPRARHVTAPRRLNHDHIVRLIGAGREPERFLIIERLDGGTLGQRCGGGGLVRDRRRRFRRKQPFNYLELLRCARQLAEGLRYLHDEAIPGRMVIHRDLKVSAVFDVFCHLMFVCC